MPVFQKRAQAKKYCDSVGGKLVWNPSGSWAKRYKCVAPPAKKAAEKKPEPKKKEAKPATQFCSATDRPVCAVALPDKTPKQYPCLKAAQHANATLVDDRFCQSVARGLPDTGDEGPQIQYG